MLTLLVSFNSADFGKIVRDMSALSFSLKQGDDEKPLNYSQIGSTMKYKLYYDDPLTLSLSQIRDTVYVRSNRRINLLLDGFNLTMYYGERAIFDVPPYIDEGIISKTHKNRSTQGHRRCRGCF